MSRRVTLITGATGLLASHLVPTILDRGDRLRALVLPSENAADLEGKGVDIFRGDVRDLDSVRLAARGVDTVFHLAAIHGLRRPWSDYLAVNVQGTQNVCQAALDVGVSRLVHVSTWNVYGSGHNKVVDETWPLRPLDEHYGRTKTMADKLVQRFSGDRGLPAVIVRPGTMIGPGDQVNFSRLAARLLAGRMIVIGSGHNALPLVYVGDVARGILQAAESSRAIGQIYNLSNDRPLTQLEFLVAISRAIGAQPPRFRVPYRLLYAAGFISERLTTLLGDRHQPPVTRLGVTQFGSENRHSIQKAHRDLGYEARVDLRDAIEMTAAWYRQPKNGKLAQSEAERLVALKSNRSVESTH